MEKPTLYVPDQVYYGDPFLSMFDVITSQKPYDCDIAKIADVVMLTGGADIDPVYYNEEAHPSTSSYGNRCAFEYKLIQYCIEREKPILGICRGAEWLAIAGGGKLFQHVTSHSVSHPITWGKFKEKIGTSSLHHQMCDLRNVPDAHVIAWADGLSNFYEGAKFGESLLPPKSLKEPEVFTIPHIKGFAVQGHPEMMDDDCHFNVLVRSSLARFLNIPEVPSDAERVNTLINTQRVTY